MESARSTGNFNRRISVADSNNIIAVLDMTRVNSKYQIFEQDYLVEFQAVLEDLKLTVNLPGLAEAPWPEVNALMNEAEKMAEIARIRTEGQKIGLGIYTAIGNGPWQYEAEVVLQNQGGSETYVPILVPFLSSNETLLISGDFKLGVKIEPKWNQPLKSADYLIVKGTYRQVVSFSKKKDDIDLDSLVASVDANLVLILNKLLSKTDPVLFNLNSTTPVNIAEDIRGAKTAATVAASATVSVALAANTGRANYSIYNAGPATVFLREGAVVSSSLYDVKIPPEFYYKEDFVGARYLGAISVITASGTASLQVSEGTLI